MQLRCQGMEAAAQAAGGVPQVTVVHLRCIEAVVNEFSPEYASSCGMSWDQHEKCKALLQASGLHGEALEAEPALPF